ncbi:MAG: ATP-binding domain-containing protein, partial [Clostridia bacterium]|nr:ATP-binding domain-containing protein [Clostridia bacterium]
LDSLRRQQQELTVTDLVLSVLQETGYQLELEQEKTSEAQARLENLKEFLTVTRSYDREKPGAGLDDFLAQVALVAETDYLDDSDKVVFMTLHSAKGLEFPVVFLAGLEEGVFHHHLSLNDQLEMEEERRLFYVGMTRAQEVLYLTHAWNRNLYGNTMNNRPSSFLEEIPPELFDTNSGSENQSQPTAPRPELKVERPARTNTRPSPWELGGKIEHKFWGIGVIVKVSGEDDDTILSVAFPEQGIKQLAVRYAPIRRV